MLKRVDYLLIFIAIDATNLKLLSPIQIMKGMFLIGQELKIEDFYEFVPYLYGPCSFEVYSDLKKLVNDGLVMEIPAHQTWASWNYYVATSKGKDKARKLIQQLDSSVVEKIKEIKKLILSMSFIELLKYVYKKYPEYARNSIINLEVFE